MSEPTTPPVVAEAKPPKWAPPIKLYLGMPVLWYEMGNPKDKARPAFIVDIGDRGICGVMVLGVKGEGQNRFYANKDGVRYIDDPDIKQFDRDEQGAWDYNEPMKSKLKSA